ncbi:hypothetical protein GCM10009422_08730 [Brevundimonas kwangchunensis]|uniref:Uncharacterized protein n=1 Tax=Brevundimonas kwangchunensis TaxID=322163 RepID=A0ABP3RS63_9CAUL
MIRTFAALAAVSILACAGAASAQTFAPSWGQPVYLDAWGRPVGGTPLSEVETRSYLETGRWADGYHERPYVYVPGQASSYRYDGYRSGYRYGHGWRDRGQSRPYQGYRDEWGYNDDRARSGRQGYVNRGRYRDADAPYFYDR